LDKYKIYNIENRVCVRERDRERGGRKEGEGGGRRRGGDGGGGGGGREGGEEGGVCLLRAFYAQGDVPSDESARELCEPSCAQFLFSIWLMRNLRLRKMISSPRFPQPFSTEPKLGSSLLLQRPMAITVLSCLPGKGDQQGQKQGPSHFLLFIPDGK
jgi:hypothetical protein